MPERSFFYKGYQFPLCARCTGVLLGQWAGIVYSVCRKPKGWELLLLLPLAIDGGTQEAGWRKSNNELRLATGIVGGFGFAVALLGLIRRNNKS